MPQTSAMDKMMSAKAIKHQKPIEMLVFGTGAVGATIGWRLSLNPRVRLSAVCRSNYEIARSRGLRMETMMWGNGTFCPDRVYRTTKEAKSVCFDYIICANKASCDDVSSFVEDLAHAVSPNTTLVAIQNGIGIEQKLKERLPRNPILSAICYVACLQEPLGTVQQTAQIRPHAFSVGRYKEGSTDPDADQNRLEEFVSLEERFKLVPDIQTERWAKLIFNGAWSPTTALSGMDTQQIINKSSPDLVLVRKLAREVFEVAAKGGFPLPDDIENTTFDAVAKSAPIIPSMLQDARKRRPMEIETLCGDIWRYADALGVPVPNMKAVYRMLSELNRTFLGSKVAELQTMRA